MFDAGYELLTNTSTSLEDGSGKVRSVVHPRAMIHVSLTVDDQDAQLIRAECPNGAGYLPDSVLDTYGCEAVIGGTVFNSKGEPIWFGRTRRYATPSQFAALVARDGGCVLCGRDPSRCEAHHIQPFNSPNRGETNIEDLALVCTSCHHGLHDTKRTLIWQHAPPNQGPNPDDDDDDGNESPIGVHTKGAQRTWTTRPATPGEIAPTKPKNKAKPTRRTQPDRTSSPAVDEIDAGQLNLR